MLKYFCDFCKAEIGIYAEYTLTIESPSVQDTSGYIHEIRTNFHLCKNCYEETKKKLNIK